MIFFSPIWLLLLLPLAAAMYLWRLPTRGLNLVRFIIILLLVLAMAQPAMKLKDQQGTVVVLIDRSESMPPKAADDQLEVLKSLHGEMGSEDRLAVVSFGDRTIIEQEPSDQATETLQSPADQQHSRLNDGLEAALSLIPPEHPGRILVVSDGHWTGRNPNAVTTRAAGRGIGIDHRWLSRPRAEDLAVRDLQVPAQVLPGQAFMISGWIHSPREQVIGYTLTKHGEELSGGERAVPRGLSRLLFRDRAKLSGNAAYRLTLRPPDADANATAPLTALGDAFPENNTARALVEVRGRKPLLLVSHFGAESGLAQLMVKGGMTLVARKPHQCPWTLADLSRWSAVVLENVMAGEIGQDGMETLAAWVEDTGAGLMVTGGEKSYAPGGYYGSPLEKLLPVSMERRNEIRKLQTAIVVVLDRSGSMSMPVAGGKTKMDLANIGTVQVLDLLSATDEFGVIAVDSAPHTVLDLASAEGQQNALFRNKILKIESMGGGIYVYEALKAASQMLMKASAANRHIILFSDAQDSEEPGDYKRLIDTMRKAGISISVIGLGTPSDVDAKLLEDIAKRGEGNIYFTDRPKEIPRIFAQDTFAVARNTFIKEPAALELAGALSTLGAPASWQPPPVGGYNLTYLRDAASLGLLTRDEYRAPIVAFWQAGNGRVACYTGEADGTYAGDLAQWPQAGDFYATLSGWAAGQQSQLPDRMLLTQDIREGICYMQLHLDPTRQGEVFTQTPRLKLLRETSGRTLRKEIRTLNWKTADLLEAAIPLEGEETVRAVASLTSQTGVPLSQSLPPVCLPYSPEFAPDQPDRGRKALAALSKTTGGRERLNLADIWTAIPRQPRYVPLSLWLVLAGLILFLLEVFQRRTGFFELRRRTAATPEETAEGRSTLRPRAAGTQSGTAGTTADEPKTFRAPKRKRRRTDRESNTPPVVAPPMLEEDSTQPPVIPPNLSDTGNTFDALSAARKRAQDRRGSEDQ